MMVMSLLPLDEADLMVSTPLTPAKYPSIGVVTKDSISLALAPMYFVLTLMAEKSRVGYWRNDSLPKDI